MQYLFSTGSNLGNRSEQLAAAMTGLQNAGASLVRASSIYETEPWGFQAGNTFFNQVLLMEADISPRKMMDQILEMEHYLGRKRSDVNVYQSRKIDIDILFVDNLIICEERLEVPHPRMHERKFVLVPAVEIVSDWVHPVLKKTLAELLLECEDTESVVRI